MVKKYYIGFMVFAILTASVYVLLPDNIRIDVENTKTIFKVYENNSWVLAGTEYTLLYDGSTKMLANSRNVSYSIDGNKTEITRTSIFKDNITAIDTYLFDGSIKDVALYPVSHKINILNADGKILDYQVNDLLYLGNTTNGIQSPQNFGHKMKVEWQEGYYYSRIFKYSGEDKGKLDVKYRINSDNETFNVRLFDPISVTLLTNSSNQNDAQTITTANVTPTANCLVLVYASAFPKSGNGIPTSVTGVNMTFALVNHTTNTIVSSVWRAMNSSPTTGGITVNWATAWYDAQWIVSEYCGVDTSGTLGSGAIVQVKNGTGSSITLNSAPSSATNYITGHWFSYYHGTMTTGVGYTRIANVYGASDNAYIMAEYSQNRQVVNMSSTASTNGGIAIEIKEAVSSDNQPKWFSNTTNGTQAGTFVKHSINWTDDINLSGYIFEFDNGTGALSNDSFIEFSGTANWSNVSKYVNETIGSAIRWRIYANDSTNQLNSTSLFSYTTTSGDNPPTYSSIQANVSNPTILDAVNFKVDWADNSLSSYIFSWNGTGALCDTFANDSVVTFSGTSNTSSINKTIPATCLGKISGIAWYVWANDSTNQVNSTPNTFSFAGDTCDYSGGNWEVDCSDNCIEHENQDLGNNNITIYGSGTFIVNANLSNVDHIIKDNLCYLNKSSDAIIS